jgi:hypothetical protein|tara:strand:+ start:335 stop:490 length:156 start_codon:yes stop_codon:yes gene_type:complete
MRICYKKIDLDTAIGALNERAQNPDCSGIFETTTGVYTDIIQASTSVLETT